jgi:hypothetical protein
MSTEGTWRWDRDGATREAVTFRRRYRPAGRGGHSPFNLLLVRGDGTHVLRLTLPRWVVGVALGGVGVGIVLVATSLGVIYSDYLSLRHQRDTMSVLLPRLTEQQGLLESYQSRVRDLRSEIAASSSPRAHSRGIRSRRGVVQARGGHRRRNGDQRARR